MHKFEKPVLPHEPLGVHPSPVLCSLCVKSGETREAERGCQALTAAGILYTESYETLAPSPIVSQRPQHREKSNQMSVLPSKQFASKNMKN